MAAPQPDPTALRQTFDEAAELYDRARPTYPAALFDDLAELACIGSGCRVLEIGCGTGKATVALAQRGSEITCVELGSSLAAVARRNLSNFPKVRIEVAAFETWSLPTERFDTVFAATAFHWIDPSVRVHKSADALQPGGALVTITTHHVAGGEEAFFAEVQSCYERWDPATPPGLRLTPAADIPFDSEDVDRSDRFGPAEFHRYEVDIAYTTSQYIDTLLTYSGHRALPPAARDGLLTCIADLINDGYNGRIRKRYAFDLRVARAVS
jgi:SAM-dependent methyltransferase